MTSPLDNGNRWAMLGFTLGMLGCLAVASAQSPAIALVNESPSLPRGLYLRTLAADPALGDVVALPQPAIARPYLRQLGMPGEVLLLKRVAAVGGGRVCRERGEVQTAGRQVQARDQDHAGRHLPVWRGCRTLQADEMFVLGDTASSFDSRYFGPIQRHEITGVYREVLTW